MYAQPLRSSSPDLYHGKYAASLFASGEQGAWYDPSDLTTMFQDAAGTTPVTGVEQPVGRILDKSGRGNHATQTTTASRPTLSARVNSLLNTEDLANAYWNRFQTTATQNFAVNHLGAQSADLVVDTTYNGEHFASNLNFAVSAGISYKLSFWVKKHTTSSGFISFGLSGAIFNWGGEVSVNLNSGSIGSAGGVVSKTSILDQGNGWFLVSMTTTAPATGTAILRIRLRSYSGEFVFAGDGVSGVYIWGVDLRVANESPLIPSYQRVNTATDYDTQGFPLYLRFDGVDDWLVTPTVNFTATDKVTVFAGVRYFGSAAGILFELSANVNNINGSFAHSINDSVAGCESFGGRVAGIARGYQYTSPSNTTRVSTGQIDAAQPTVAAELSMRINGVVQAPVAGSTLQMGDGTFGNHPLYIGRRGGTTLPFNGRIYGLIVCGAQTDSQHITNVERLLAHKSGVAL